MTTCRDAAKIIVATLQQELKRAHFVGNFMVSLTDTKATLYKLRNDSLYPEETCKEVDITPPRPTPPEGTPCLGWNDNKVNAVLGMSSGEVESRAYMPGDPEEDFLFMRVNDEDIRCFRYWSVLVEKEVNSDDC
jgi:hypothetical protein